MKKNIKSTVTGSLLFFIMLIILSCKKEAYNISPVASLTVTNAIIEGPSVRVGSIVAPILNNASAQLAIKAGENDLYVWPVGDSANPYYTNSKFYTEPRRIYSLFLAGKSPGIVGIVLQDNILYHTDSTCGIRIINLSPNSLALNIILATTLTVKEVSNLSYLQYTDFKLYAAKAVNTSYTFQIRNASDNSILVTYPLLTPRFTNVTLVIRGLVNSTGATALGITRINNDR